MENERITQVLVLIALLIIAPAQLSANEFDYHILNAGINLGWAKGTVDLFGNDNRIQPYLSAVATNAAEHLSFAQTLVNGTIWEFLQLTDVNDLIQRFLSSAGRNAEQNASGINNIRSFVTQRLAVFLRSPGNFESGPTCASELFTTAYHFGRAYIGAFAGDVSYHNSAKGDFLRSINSGLRLAPIRGCDFATTDEWGDLPYSNPFNLAVYEATLYPLQLLAAQLNNDMIPPPPPALPTLPPVLSDPDPIINISGVWNSNINNVYIIDQEGKRFTWRVRGHSEVGEGEINGTNISARWGNDGVNWLGFTDGRIIVDSHGRAIRIEWNNTAVFTR